MIKYPKLDAYRARVLIESVQENLAQKPAKASIRDMRDLVKLAAEWEANRNRIYELEDEERRLHNLIIEWNSIWEAALARNIIVSQRFGQDTWDWSWNDLEGSADTPGEALLAALEARGKHNV